MLSRHLWSQSSGLCEFFLTKFFMFFLNLIDKYLTDTYIICFLSPSHKLIYEILRAKIFQWQFFRNMFRDSLFFVLDKWPLSDDWVRSTEVEVTSEFREGPPPSHAERSCQRVLHRNIVHTHALRRSPTDRNRTSLLLTRQTLAIEGHRPMHEYKLDRSFSNTNTHSSTGSGPPPPHSFVTHPLQSFTFSLIVLCAQTAVINFDK